MRGFAHWAFDLDKLPEGALGALRKAANKARRYGVEPRGTMVHVDHAGTTFHIQVFPSGWTLLKRVY